MPIDPSMEPMLEVFIYETTTLLDQLDEILLDSEKSKCFNSDNIDAIFRIMHTIKGSAAMMDFKGISTLAHAVEDVFYIIREDTSRMDRVSEAIFELVFQSSDFFKEQIEEVQNDHDATGDPTSLINQLESRAARPRQQRRRSRRPRRTASAGSGCTLRTAARWKTSAHSC